VALFLTFNFRHVDMGIAMAKLAVGLNPSCSPELWNTLGDALFEAGQTEEARLAYQRALRINPGDVRARFNLVWVLARQGQHRQALAMVAEALGLDETGEYYERLLKKQNEILGQLNQRQRQKQLLLANRVSKRVVPGELWMHRPEGTDRNGDVAKELPRRASPVERTLEQETGVTANDR
jgi:tetratricopeptide (TPR) repeat protein